MHSIVHTYGTASYAIITSNVSTRTAGSCLLPRKWTLRRSGNTLVAATILSRHITFTSNRLLRASLFAVMVSADWCVDGLVA